MVNRVDNSALDRPSLQLTTERLILRPVEDADAAATASLVTGDIAANLLTWPSPMSCAQALARIRESKDKLERRDAVNFAIIRKSDGQLMGWLGLFCVESGTARLGYWLGVEFRGGFHV
jgi:RimJ/RimL family protein N-acetyltransferase